MSILQTAALLIKSIRSNLNLVQNVRICSVMRSNTFLGFIDLKFTSTLKWLTGVFKGISNWEAKCSEKMMSYLDDI